MNITHDLHLHTGLSLCAPREAKFEDFIEPALKMGLKKIGISNHFWHEDIPPLYEDGYFIIQNYKYIATEADAIRREKRINISFGCEAEYNYVMGDVAMPEECAERFDHILVAHSHTHLIMPRELAEDPARHMQFLMKSYADIIRGKLSKYITAIAHPFDPICTPLEIVWKMYDTVTDDDFRFLLDETAERGIAYELNVGGHSLKTREDFEKLPVLRPARLAKECGCKFTFGSDAHSAPEFTYYKENAELLADILSLTDDDIAKI